MKREIREVCTGTKMSGKPSSQDWKQRLVRTILVVSRSSREASLITTPANKKILHGAVALILVCIFTGFAPVLLHAQLSTYDHLTEPGWWPQREPTSRKEFVGNAACAKCHATITASQETTAMAHTLMPSAAADVLHSRTDLSFRNGKYLYQIKDKGSAPELTVT